MKLARLMIAAGLAAILPLAAAQAAESVHIVALPNWHGDQMEASDLATVQATAAGDPAVENALARDGYTSSDVVDLTHEGNVVSVYVTHGGLL